MTKEPAILAKAKSRIVLDQPWFASLLLKYPLTPTDAVPTAGVDARGRIYYNPAGVEKLTAQQVVFLLCHEVMHKVCQHAFRQGSREKQLWNIAGDAFINDTLIDCKVGEFIEGGVKMPGSKDKTTEQIYEELQKQQEQQDGGGGEQQGPGGIGNDLIACEDGEPTDSELKEIEARMKVDVAQATQAAKMRGQLPAALARIAEQVINVKTPWYELLERFMVGRVRADYSWARPNRRFLPLGLYLPVVGTLPQMGELVVQVDVSGSISPLEVAHYNGHLSRIIEQCRPQKVHLLYVDTDVVRHETFEQDEELVIQFMSGGGTDMPAGIRYVEEQGINAEAMVVLTDGYTPWGEDPGFPVLWCISTEARAPYGENVPFEVSA